MRLCFGGTGPVSVSAASFVTAIGIVIASGAQEEVLRIDTQGVVTSMENAFSFRNAPEVDLPRKPMCQVNGVVRPATDFDVSVTVASFRPRPEPTTFCLSNSLPKPGDYGSPRSSEHAVSLVCLLQSMYPKCDREASTGVAEPIIVVTPPDPTKPTGKITVVLNLPPDVKGGNYTLTN